jgi:hypothetical protein
MTTIVDKVKLVIVERDSPDIDRARYLSFKGRRDARLSGGDRQA